VAIEQKPDLRSTWRITTYRRNIAAINKGVCNAVIALGKSREAILQWRETERLLKTKVTSTWDARGIHFPRGDPPGDDNYGYQGPFRSCLR
jgi:hypothetical protein